jgi:hypothetical protein
VVLVDQAAEPIVAVNLAGSRCQCPLIGLPRLELERTMRSVLVVMVDLNATHALEVPAVEDQQPVKTLGAHCPDEALRNGVRLRRPRRRLHDPDAGAANTSSKKPLYLLSRSLIRKRTDCSAKSRPRLRACWSPRRRSGWPCRLQPDAPARMRDEEEHIAAAKEDAVDGEEVAATMLAA